jgi:hypothetical protein
MLGFGGAQAFWIIFGLVAYKQMLRLQRKSLQGIVSVTLEVPCLGPCPCPCQLSTVNCVLLAQALACACQAPHHLGRITLLQIRHKISLPRFNDYLQMNKKRLIFHDWRVDTTGDDIEVCWEDLDTSKWAGVVPRFTAKYSAHTSTIATVTVMYQRNMGKSGIAFNAQVRVRVGGHVLCTCSTCFSHACS